LALEWAKFKEERQAFESEKAAFEEERIASGLEIKLFVGNLGSETTEETVKTLFEQYGSVKEVHLLKDRDGKSKRSCFVKFFTTKEAKAAIEGLDGKHKDEDARDCFAVRMANAKGAVKAMPSAGVSGWGAQPGYPAADAGYGAAAGFGAANGYPANGGGYQQPAYNQPPPAFNGYGATGGAQFPAYSAPAPPAATGSMGSGRGPTGANLYVNNLTSTTTQQEVKAMFDDFGKVVSVKIFPANSGFAYGFVSFDDANAAQAAIRALDGQALPGSAGRALEVRLKSDKTSKGNRFAPY